VLTEIGFISNPAEENYMNSASGQSEIVSAIFDAVKKYKKQTEVN
jgi:N-acetylmuramoyl-L-alanine amidase